LSAFSPVVSFMLFLSVSLFGERSASCCRSGVRMSMNFQFSLFTASFIVQLNFSIFSWMSMLKVSAR